MGGDANREHGWWWGPALVAASIVLAVLVVVVDSQKSPDRLAAALLQGMAILFGTIGSYVFGRVSARESARDLVKQPARSAFRRVRTLYEALGRQRLSISAHLLRLESLRVATDPQFIDFEHVRASLTSLDTMVVEQLSTADDALEDWRDLAPDEVADIQRQAREESGVNG